MVSAHRDITIDWRPFSLAMKNGELDDTKDGDNVSHLAAHRVLRIMLAAEKQGASLIDMYTTFGIKYHVAGFDFDDETMAGVLNEHHLPADLIEAGDDTSYDVQLRVSMQSAIDIAGNDIGVPTIVFEAEDGTLNGYFGPVLQTLPELEDALRLWDGLSMLATDKNFYELKRSRPSDGPDVASTARC